MIALDALFVLFLASLAIPAAVVFACAILGLFGNR